MKCQVGALMLTAVTHFLSVSVSTAVVQVDGNPVRLQLCDTAGQVSFVHAHKHIFVILFGNFHA